MYLWSYYNDFIHRYPDDLVEGEVEVQCGGSLVRGDFCSCIQVCWYGPISMLEFFQCTLYPI